jgi:hypothetical protein
MLLLSIVNSPIPLKMVQYQMVAAGEGSNRSTYITFYESLDIEFDILAIPRGYLAEVLAV